MDVRSPVLEGVKLARSFPDGDSNRAVIESVSVRLDRGRIVALLGPNAVGKSTVVRLLGGLDRPDSGYVNRAPGTSVGVQLQEVDETLLPWRDNIGNAAFGLEALGVSREEARSQVADLVQGYGLNVPLGKATATSSGGERQMVSVIRAVVVSPDALLLDEPFSRIDPTRVRAWWRFLRRYTQNKACGCLVVTHNVVEAAILADEVHVMSVSGTERGARITKVIHAPDGGEPGERPAADPAFVSRITTALESTYA